MYPKLIYYCVRCSDENKGAVERSYRSLFATDTVRAVDSCPCSTTTVSLLMDSEGAAGVHDVNDTLASPRRREWMGH